MLIVPDILTSSSIVILGMVFSAVLYKLYTTVPVDDDLIRIRKDKARHFYKLRQRRK
jgi:hypothetical protein